jgi:hypothetical protein
MPPSAACRARFATGLLKISGVRQRKCGRSERVEEKHFWIFHTPAKNQASEKPALPNFSHSREKSNCDNCSRSAPGTQASRAGSRNAEAAPLKAAAPGAFCNGIVKDLQPLVPEPLLFPQRQISPPAAIFA